MRTNAVLIILVVLLLGTAPISGDAEADVNITSTKNYRWIRINNLENWYLTSDDTKDRHKILSILAERDNVCATEHWSVLPRDIHNINKQNEHKRLTRVYRIYDLMVKCDWDSDWKNSSDTSRMQTPLTKSIIDANDWWLRDGNGDIVKESEQIWMLDVGKPGFKEAFLDAVLARNQGKGFDGFVFDYWWTSLTSLSNGICDSWFDKHPRPQAYATDNDWFFRAWKPFIEYVCKGVKASGYRIIGNCVGEYNTTDPRQRWQRTQVDGVIYEQFAVNWPQVGADWLPGRVIEDRIDSFSRDPLEVWATDYGLQPDYPDFDKKRHAALAMYYVATPASQEKRSYHYINNRKVFWDPLWDLNIGTPAENAVKMAGKYFWSRKYSKGMVILNYEESQSISFTLDRTYKDIDGKTYSGTITVPPHTGMILAVN